MTEETIDQQLARLLEEGRITQTDVDAALAFRDALSKPTRREIRDALLAMDAEPRDE